MSDFDDFLEEEEVSEAQTEDTIKKITRLVRRMKDLEGVHEKLKIEAALVAREMDDIQTRQIPDALLESGVTEIKTLDGLKVSTKLFVGGIPAEKKTEVYSWLDTNGHGDVIKRSVAVSFTKGEESAAKHTMELLKEAGLAPAEKLDVHYQTFAALMKELSLKGVSIPLDQWGVYYGQKATIGKN